MNDYFKLIDNKWCVDVYKLDLIVDDANVVNDGDIKIIFGFGPMVFVYDENGNKKETRSLQLATKFSTKPVEVEHNKDEGHYIYTYYKKRAEENPFIMSKNLIKDITNVEYMFSLISAGKVNTSIDYREYIDIIINSMELNKELDVSERDIEILLSEYFRDAKDPSKPVRVTGNDEYTVMSFRNLTAQQSTFNSITFEDPKTMLTASLGRKESEETMSPLEKYMKV